MNDYIVNLFKEILWTALKDLWGDISSWADEKIEEELKKLSDQVGNPEPLSSSPLVRVTAYSTSEDPNAGDKITFLIRGSIPLFKGVESVFMRVEVTISTRIDLEHFDPPIVIDEWLTIIGDLKISKKNVFTANLGFGYDNGSWLGRGALKILPAGFGLDIFLGGLSDRGAMIGLSIDLPSAVPLGSTGLCLIGMGGDFAYNFIPRLEDNGVQITDPTAKDYITWARDNEPLNRWKDGPIDQTAVGIGINTDLCTLLDNGRTLALEPIGLAVLTPGPVFVLGGKGKLLNCNTARVEGYLAVDIPSKSMALGLGVKIQIPHPKDNNEEYQFDEKYLLYASGTLDAFFSFSNPSTWYINLGTDKQKITAKVITDLIRAEVYLMLNNYRVAFGAGLSVGFTKGWKYFNFTARVGADVAAVIGWNPVLLEGLLRIWMELGLTIWKFKFLLRGSAEVVGYVHDPTKLDFIMKVKLDLPWPIPDIPQPPAEIKFTLGDENPSPPIIDSPLLTGISTVDGSTTEGVLKTGLLHCLTGRQWEINPNSRECWPDVDIVIPFSCRVTDQTSLVVGSTVSSPIQGGYVVAHKLTKLTLDNISSGAPGSPVPGLQAVWAAGPGGDTARLHVLGSDPFSWVVPHIEVISSTTETPGITRQQDFGIGPAEAFADERRFGEMLVRSYGPVAQLLNDFLPLLPTRVLQAGQIHLRFRTWLDQPIEVGKVTLLLLINPDMKYALKVDPGNMEPILVLRDIYDSMQLVAITINLSPATDKLTLSISGEELMLIYAVCYLEARASTCNWQEKVVLEPGSYMLKLEGESQATHPGGELPESKKITWSTEETFMVNYPETLRPYIDTTTIGDSRIFDVDSPSREPEWNPTMHGFGFPIYKKYQGSVLFRVPYMNKIFPVIRFRLIYEKGYFMEQDLIPTANSLGDSYLPDQSIKWINDHCGNITADQEVTMTLPFTESGSAAVRLLFEDTSGNEIKLDEWTCYVSKFDSFTDQLTWPKHCITIFYGPAGRYQRTSCSLPGTPEMMGNLLNLKGNRIDPILLRKDTVHSPDLSGHKVPLEPDSITGIGTLPEEFTAPPVNWCLQSSLTNWILPLDENTGKRFACFAYETGARFNEGIGDPLKGINDTVGETTIEAITDSAQKPYALWLRLPEPVDWRRVTVALRVRHVEGTGDCPSGYARRYPLDLQMEILPGADGSSAFLIGSLAGHRTLLPRGVYMLTLNFSTQVANLPILKPSSGLGGPVEQVVFTFVQPGGTNWPLPFSWRRIIDILKGWFLKTIGMIWQIIKGLWLPRPQTRIMKSPGINKEGGEI